MDLKRLSSKAKELVEKRGGSASLKEDAAELRRIADGPGSLGDKAKAAAAAIKKPGEDEPGDAAAKAPPAEQAPSEDAGEQGSA